MKIEKLYPAFKDYLWGGNTLKEKYGKLTDTEPLAESWELSFHRDGLCRLENGKTLSQTVTKEDLGSKLDKFSDFPVLIKFIDAKSDLSVQVHPSDEFAKKYEGGLGKTEMWYVAEADKNAGIYLGFKNDVTKEEYEAAINDGTLCSLLNFVKVKKGDCYFIPAGTIHAIGAGCLICEIQENSNLTYRVFDYKRKDKNGNERELHIDKALTVTNLHQFRPISSDPPILAKCEYFTVSKLILNDTATYRTDTESFHSLTCIAGNGEIDGKTISRGDTFFIPANYGEYTLSGNAELLLCRL